MDPALGGAGLEQLLAVLLRVLSPAAVPPGTRPGGTDHADGAGPATPVPGGDAPAGPAPGSPGPATPGPATPVPGGDAPAGPGRGSRGPGNSAPSGSAVGGDAPAGVPAVTASEARALTELLAAHGIAQGQLAAL